VIKKISRAFFLYFSPMRGFFAAFPGDMRAQSTQFALSRLR
jgi:hypothetical protein